MQEPKNQTNTTKPTSDPKISEKDLTLLENIIKEWYTNNSDKLFTSKNSNIMKYMRNISKQLDSFRKFNSPAYLYRGISFENDKLKDEALKKMKEQGILKHPTKDYDSWSSSKEVAECYAFGDKAWHKDKGRAYVILQIPYIGLEDELLFTCEYLFTGEDTKESRMLKQRFFRKILNNKLNNLVKDIKSANYKKNQWDATIQDISNITPGLSRALTEFEYILKPVKADSIKILMQTKK